ncbi:MAG: lyase family protein [Candidatus Kapaibacterium sp.]
MQSRVEKDLLGKMEIPADSYTGIHTARARANFPISDKFIRPEIIRAIGTVKKAAAEANLELGYLDADKADAIILAAGEAAGGRFRELFDLDALQGGAGTSANMAVNEVIANRALELLGRRKGDYSAINPIGHVNLHQSTNDVFPTALKIAAIEGIRLLAGAAEELQGELQRKESEFAGIPFIGRTEMQNAVPVTLGAVFASLAEAVSRDRWRTFKCEERLRVVNIGGTAVGSGLTAPRRYIFLVIEKLRLETGYGLSRAEQIMGETANADAFVEVSGILDAAAANIIKIAGDLRLLHFTGEITLPAMQAGSSIMPGKVNPVICESAIQSGMRAQANHGLLARCAASGSLQINEFMPLIADCLIDSIYILKNIFSIFAKHVSGISANREVCERIFRESESIITAFVPHIGYERCEALAAEFRNSPEDDFKEFLSDKLGAELVQRTLAPENLMSLGFR